ncbi:MAG: hypothetical protein JST63_10695 [Bacteroidetes bacterium]|nr:hypothetical protein [Bacteroidota bacterium]
MLNNIRFANYMWKRVSRIDDKNMHLLCTWLLFFLPAGNLFSQGAALQNLKKDIDIQPALQEAVDKARDGDVIILPEGEFYVGKTVVITRFISLRGQGLKKTILYQPEATPDSVLRQRDHINIIRYDINKETPGNIVISDIGFRSKKPSIVDGDGGSTARTSGITLIRCIDFIIERCRFEYFGNSGISVRHQDTLARGLIRNNEFYYNAGNGLGYGVTVYGSNDQWIPDPKFGTSNFIFVEDNVFDFHRHSIAANSGSLFVFRHNKVLNNIAASGGHAIDVHEARQEPYGSRAMEVYNNVLINTTYTDSTPIIKGVRKSPSGGVLETAGIAIRNGDALVFNNIVKGYEYAVTMSNWYWGRTVQPYPMPYSPGYLSGKLLGPDHSGIGSAESRGDAFIWNNTNDPFLEGKNDTAALFRNFEPDWWKEGRDYHFQPKPGYQPYPYPYLVKTKDRAEGTEIVLKLH